MAKTLYKYDGEVNKVTWFVTWNYSLRNYYTNDVNYVPDPIVGSAYNTYVEFRSYEPGMVNIDWGDGNKEQVAMTYIPSSNFYVVMFRSLNIEYRKDPNVSVWWYKKSDGSQYIPVPPHHYEDDSTTTQRAVTLDFTCPVSKAYFRTCHFTEFPILDLPDLDTLSIADSKGISSIPYDRLARATKLTQIDFYGLGSVKMDVLPESITSKASINTLNIGSCFDFSDIEASGLRRIGDITGLVGLNVRNNSLTKYIKEFNDLPNLLSLGMEYGGKAISDEMFADFPDMSEVDRINPRLRSLGLFAAWYSGAGVNRRKRIPDSLNGKGVENLTSISLAYNRDIDYSLPFPDWIYECRSVSFFNVNCCFDTVEKADRFVAGIYNATTNWEQSTMSQTAKDGKRNQWYGMSFSLYASQYPEFKRPSGEERAPDGFVKGESNGNPVTGMEMVYVLKNNYAQKWNVPPE